MYIYKIPCVSRFFLCCAMMSASWLPGVFDLRIFSETFMFRPMQGDRYLNWKPGAIMVSMQEMAGTHSALLGLDRDTQVARFGAVWVLTRNELEIFQMPKVGQMVVATTYPGPPRRGLYPRYHHFKLEDGTPLARGIGGWVLADIESRRMVDVPAVAALMPDTKELPRWASFPQSVDMLGEGEERVQSRELQYTDFDMNHHVNNTRCADWVQDLLGDEVLGKRAITSFVTAYRQEILPGGPVTLRLRLKGDRFSMKGEREGAVLLEASGTLGRLS